MPLFDKKKTGAIYARFLYGMGIVLPRSAKRLEGSFALL